MASTDPPVIEEPPASRKRPGAARAADHVWQPATSVFDEPVDVSRLVLRYAVTGLVALVVVAVALAYVSRSLGVEEAVDDAIGVADVAASVGLQPVLDDGILTGDPAVLAAIDELVRDHILKGQLVRVKIWSRDGTILYSDEARLIGEEFTLDEEELDILDGRAEATGGISDLDEPENRFERRAVELLEVYAPLSTPGGTKLLFEAYFQYEGVAAAGRGVWLRFAPFSLGALVLLELLQVPLALSLARRLRATQYQREDLLRRAIEATDKERSRIASDLHDGVVQDLAGVAFSLAAIARDDGPEPRHNEAVREAADQVRDAVRSLRSLLVEIYPPNLYAEGLESALSDLLATVQARNIRPSLLIDGPLRELPLDTSQLIYRVAQEGLRNVISHSDASQVDVAVEVTPGSATLDVTDNGRGLVGGVPPEREGHLGLKALSGLATNMGAALSISSTPGKGTTLRLEVPRR